MSTIDTLKALVDAGGLATDGEWQTRFIYRLFHFSRLSHEVEMNTPKSSDWTDADFIAAAANARPALKQLISEHETLGEIVDGSKRVIGEKQVTIKSLQSEIKAMGDVKDGVIRDLDEALRNAHMVISGVRDNNLVSTHSLDWHLDHTWDALLRNETQIEAANKLKGGA